MIGLICSIQHILSYLKISMLFWFPFLFYSRATIILWLIHDYQLVWINHFVLGVHVYFVFFSQKVTLEAEVTNKGALALYGRLGFVRAKRLFRYYLNGVDAFRLKLLFPSPLLHPSLSMATDKDDSHWHNDHFPIEECSEVRWGKSSKNFHLHTCFTTRNGTTYKRRDLVLR